MSALLFRVLCYGHGYDWLVRVALGAFTTRHKAWVYLVAASFTALTAHGVGWVAGVKSGFQENCPHFIEHDSAFWHQAQLERQLFLPANSAAARELDDYDTARADAWLCR